MGYNADDNPIETNDLRYIPFAKSSAGPDVHLRQRRKTINAAFDELVCSVAPRSTKRRRTDTARPDRPISLIATAKPVREPSFTKQKHALQLPSSDDSVEHRWETTLRAAAEEEGHRTLHRMREASPLELYYDQPSFTDRSYDL